MVVVYVHVQVVVFLGLVFSQQLWCIYVESNSYKLYLHVLMVQQRRMVVVLLHPKTHRLIVLFGCCLC